MSHVLHMVPRCDAQWAMGGTAHWPTSHILRLLSSPTARDPCCEKETPKGFEKEAAAPAPSAEPRVVEPANVVTSPVATVIMRSMWLLLSATAMRVPC